MSDDIRTLAQRYIDAGWAVLPLLAGEKGTRDPHWLEKASKRGYKPEDFPVGCNIGAVPGKPSGDRVDIDLDAPTAVRAGRLLPTTGLIHGRPSKPNSHHWYLCPGIEAKQFKDPVDKQMLMEIRAGNGQTMLPGSIHPSGEAVSWDSDREPLSIEPPNLLAMVTHVAIIALLAKYWPGQGSRHQIALSTAGFLGRFIEDHATVVRIMREVFIIAGDNELEMRERAVRDTLAKLKAEGRKVTGAPSFRADFPHGDLIADAILGWLGGESTDAIDRLNERYFVVGLASETVVAEMVETSFIFRSFSEFKQKLIKAPAVKKGKRLMPLADAWLSSPRGRQHDRFIYAPPGARHAAHPEDYNGWRGFAVEPKEGDWSKNREHIRNIICAGNDVLCEWILDWCAALVQEPGKHAESSIVLLGGQGTGKGHFVDKMLGRIFDPHHYVTVIDRRRIFGDFNEVLSGRVLIFLDESTWGGDKRDAGIIKGLVTGDTLDINRKHITATSESSLLHLIIASNERWPVGLDPDDRRFCVTQVATTAADDLDYFTRLHEELDNGGLAAMLHDLLTRKYSWNTLRRPPHTDAKRDLKGRTLDPDAKWWYEQLLTGVIGEEGCWPEQISCTQIYDAYLRTMQALRMNRIQVPNEFGATLRRFLPRLERVRITQETGKTWGYLIPSLAECRASFETVLKSPFTWPKEETAIVSKPHPVEDLPF